jgi:hypothetical protein
MEFKQNSNPNLGDSTEYKVFRGVQVPWTRIQHDTRPNGPKDGDGAPCKFWTSTYFDDFRWLGPDNDMGPVALESLSL